MGMVKIQVEFARMLIVLVRGRAASARRQGRSELGASAVEWAIISAIVVTLAIAVSVVVARVVNSRSNEIGEGAG